VSIETVVCWVRRLLGSRCDQHWAVVMTDRMSCLAACQGSPVAGLELRFFCGDMPRGRSATYLRIVSDAVDDGASSDSSSWTTLAPNLALWACSIAAMLSWGMSSDGSSSSDDCDPNSYYPKSSVSSSSVV
jgi:hypothetical protein